VEESKVAAYTLMGYRSEKHDAMRAEMDELPEPNPKYIL